MKLHTTLLSLFLVFGVNCKYQNGGRVATFLEREEKLGDRISVSWSVDFIQESVTFVVTAATTGFIGFGFSPNGGMIGADVIIGGVDSDGNPYFTDRFATAEAEPKIDDHQDWFLIDATENATHTVLHFNRTFNTCDPEDLPITSDTTKFIWSLGKTDQITYHEESGAAAVNILDPPIPAVDTSKFEYYDAMVNTTIPTQDTTYWCSVHKSPRFSSKRHLVGFEVFLDTPEAVKHTHHIMITMCPTKVGSPERDILESYVGHPGGNCYENDGTGIDAAGQFCQTSVYLWTKGGVPFFLDEDIGILLNEDGLEEYFYLEVHYDNPQVLDGVQYETGIRTYATDELRPLEAGLIALSLAVDITQTLPPSTREYVYAAHCSPRCTGAEIPEDGINIFNVLHHAHLAGRKLKFRHFRPTTNGTFVELPWISFDNQYDFDFQSNRPLKDPIKVLPGDQLTIECTYDTTWKNPPSATFGGLSTREEMCEVVFLYYPKIPLSYCGSFYPLEDMLPILGIEEIDSASYWRDPTVLKPEEFAGFNYTTVVDKMLTWTEDMKKELEVKSRYGDHVEECNVLYIEIPIEPEARAGRLYEHKTQNKQEVLWTSYPKDFEEYVPPSDNCPKHNYPFRY